MPASIYPPKRTEHDSPSTSAQRPCTRPGAGNPQSRFVNRIPGGGGEKGEQAEGKAGAAAHWLEFGAVSAVPSSLRVWEEGGRSTRVTPRLSP